MVNLVTTGSDLISFWNDRIKFYLIFYFYSILSILYGW